MGICIKKIEICGNGKEPSSIEFSEGLNIITGPSNCGKTLIYKCIDYCLGADNNPLLDYEGYDLVELTLLHNGKEIILSRSSNAKTVYIKSNDTNISTKEYSIDSKSFENSLNSVILKLIGINERHEIVKNVKYDKQELTWRSFYHLFFLDEYRIISDSSPFLKNNIYTNTAILSILIFLLFNKDFSSTTAIDSKQIKEARQIAVKNYLNTKIQELSKKTQVLEEELENINIEEYENKINKELDVLSQIQDQLDNKLNENNNLLKIINDKNQELIEKKLLLERYAILKTQYASDLERLNFIIDGQINYEPASETTCPFCDNKIQKKDAPDYFEVAIHNYKTIKLQLGDLEKTMDNLSNSISELEKEIQEKKNRKNDLDNEINSKIKPQISFLKDELSEFRRYADKNNELKTLRNLCESLNNDINNQKIQLEKVVQYNPKDFLESTFVNDFIPLLKNILQECNFTNLNTVSFDERILDIIINGKKKASNGKGYKAFFNSIILITLSKMLYEKGYYKTNFLMLDSPLLPLQEEKDENEKIQESIKKGFLSYLQDFSKQVQTIIIENELPMVDLKDANVIQFTKDKIKGRYGFINNYFDY